MAISYGRRHAGHATAIRQRLSALLAGGGPAVVDPGEVVDAAVVHLAQGPMLVEGLRRAGIDAVGVESFNVLTNTLTAMRVRVRRRDLLAATHVLERLRNREHDGQGFGGGEVDEDLAAADDLAQTAMGDLFVAADRLAHNPWDMDLVATVRLVRSRLARKPPFGVEPKTWRQLATLAGAVVAAGDTGDEEQAGEAARALRRFLRDYV